MQRKRVGKSILNFPYMKSALVVLCISVFSLLFLHFSYTSPEEQLAALNAKRAIPDEENAALHYVKLVNHSISLTYQNLAKPITNKRYLDDIDLFENSLEDLEHFIGSKRLLRLRRHPWKRAKYPTLAARIDEQRERIKILFQASQMNSYVMPFSNEFDRNRSTWSDRIYYLLRLSNRLIPLTINLDLGEGRVTDSYDKANTLVRMGHHMQQQPALLDIYYGKEHELIGLNHINQMLLRGYLDPQIFDVNELRSNCGSLTGKWHDQAPSINQHHQIFVALERKHKLITSSFKFDLASIWTTLQNDQASSTAAPLNEPPSTFYQELLVQRKHHRLFIELWHFKNQHGRWPAYLNQLTDKLPEKVLEEIPRDNPLFIFTPDNSFVFVEKTIEKQQKLVIYNHQPLSEHDQGVITQQILQLVDNLPKLSTSDQIQLKRLQSLAVPHLLTYLYDPNIELRHEVVKILVEIACSDDFFIDRDTSFLPQLIDYWLSEPDSHELAYTLRKNPNNSSKSESSPIELLLGDFKWDYLDVLLDLDSHQKQKIGDQLWHHFSQPDRQATKTLITDVLLKLSPIENLGRILENWFCIEQNPAINQEIQTYIIDNLDIIAAGELTNWNSDRETFFFVFLGKEELTIEKAEKIHLKLQKWWNKNKEALLNNTEIGPDKLETMHQEYRDMDPQYESYDSMDRMFIY